MDINFPLCQVFKLQIKTIISDVKTQKNEENNMVCLLKKVIVKRKRGKKVDKNYPLKM